MTTPAAPAPATGATTEDVQALLQRIFSSANWRGEVEKTAKKNVKLLAKVRELTTENDELKKKQPKDGERLLSKDEAVEFEALKALQLKPDELKTIIKEHGELKAKDNERAEEAQYGEAAEALGYENVPALTRWLKREKLVLEFKDTKIEDEEGKKVTVKMPYVRPAADEKATAVALEEYIENEVPEFVDIFKVKPTSEDDDEEVEGHVNHGDEPDDDFVGRAARAAAARTAGRGGVRIPATRSADRSTGSSKDKKVLEKMEQEARNNPAYSM